MREPPPDADQRPRRASVLGLLGAGRGRAHHGSETAEYDGIEIFGGSGARAATDDAATPSDEAESRTANAAAAPPPPPPADGQEPAARAGLRRRGPRSLRPAAVLVVLLGCAAVLATGVWHGRDAARHAAQAAAAYTPPPPSIAGLRPASYTIALIGDGSVRVDGSDLPPEQTWPPLLAVGLDARVVRTALDGAGYATPGPGGETFVDAAARIPRGADMVVFVGGAADAGATRVATATAATRAFSAAAQRAPGADLVAVGPLFVGRGEDPAGVRGDRVALRSAAAIGGVRWIDPVADRWFRGVSAFSDLGRSEQYSIFERLQVRLEPELAMRRS